MQRQKFPVGSRPVSPGRRGLAVASALVAFVGLAGTACSSGETSDGAGTTAAARPSTVERPSATSGSGSTGTTAPDEKASSDSLYPDGLRDVRYCEVLLLEKPDEYVAEVWNTLGYSDCPQADWDALDAQAIAEQRGAVAALMNGPRHWTLDEIVSEIRKTAPTTHFGPIEMFRAATVPLGPDIPAQTPYVPRGVERETVFRFRAGSEVYELTDPDGHVYVMQSYAQIVDPTLTIDRLAGLGSVLRLPTGWTFASRVLDEDLDVLSTDGVATIVQDELQDTYQRVR